MKRGLLWILAAVLFLGTSAHGLEPTAQAPPLALTEAEHAYLSQLGALRVLTVPDGQPYSYQGVGVSMDLLARLCDTAGIELAPIQALDYSDALLRLSRGEGELTALKFSPRIEGEDLLPYLRAPMQMVYDRHASLSDRSDLSIAQLPGIDFSYSDKYSFVNESTFPTVQDCLDAVRGRRVDMFLCDLYQLSVYSDSFAARDLTMANLPQREVVVGFGLGPHADPRLISALERTVDSFSTSELSTRLTLHQQYHQPGFQLLQLVYANPFELLCAVSALFFVVVLGLFVSFRIRVGQRQELRGYEDSYRMLAETFGEAGIEYDFLKDRLTVFGGRRERIDLPEVVEQVHTALARQSLRLSLAPEALDALLRNNAPGCSYETELQCGLKEGSWNWFRMIYIVVSTSESHRRPIRLIGCLVNIQQERMERERLLKIGYNDQLTGLRNRAAAEREIECALVADTGRRVLLFLDIDYFKSFNDRQGHSCGDAVLKALAAALGEIFPQDGILSRWGGDEFLMFLQGAAAQPDHLRSCLERLQAAMGAFSYLGQPLPVTLSIGGAAAPEETSFRALFEWADAALYRVKDGGRNDVCILSHDGHGSRREETP